MKLFSQFFTISALILMSACSSSDDSSSGSTSTTISLPSSAVTISSDNANSVATLALSNIELVTAIASGVEAGLPPIRQSIDTLIDYIGNKKHRSISIVSGVTETDQCDNGGTISDTYSETNTSESGSATFNNCEIEGVIFDGSLSYSSTWNNSTGAYTDSGNGTLTISYAGSYSFILAVNFSDTGNESTGVFSISLSYSFTESTIGGFMLTTTTPLAGTFDTVTSGEVIVTGANNSRLRMTVTTANTVDIYLDNGDGNFVFHGSTSI